MSNSITIKGKTPEQRAASADTMLKNGLSHWRKTGIALGAILYTIYDEGLWRFSDLPSFAAYLAQPEIDLRTSQGYLLLRVYQRFCIEDEVDPDMLSDVAPSKLDLCVPYIKHEDSDELIRLARELTRNDLKAYLAEKYDGKKDDEPDTCVKRCPYWQLDAGTGKWRCSK